MWFLNFVYFGQHFTLEEDDAYKAVSRRIEICIHAS